MSLWAMLLVALSVSLDALAVSLAAGAVDRRRVWRNATLAAIFFGGFQLLMPLLGWLLGRAIGPRIGSCDHWVAFALLALVGGKMMFEACRGTGGLPPESPFRLRTLLALAVATSLDALAVGASLALIGAAIWLCALLMGAVTGVCSFAGVCGGGAVGKLAGRPAGFAGGMAIALIGVKTLFEHLGA